MRLRNTLVSLGLVGALACGWAATASVVTSDSMSQAITARSAVVTNRSSQLDELGAHHRDDNSDIAAVSLSGLAVEVELPKEIGDPTGRSVEAPNVSAQGTPTRRTWSWAI